MAPDGTELPAQPTSTSLASQPYSRSSRRLAVATAIVFLVSLAFPITAALSKDRSSFPRWWGPADVGLAFALAFMAIAVVTVAGPRVTQATRDRTYRAYRVLLHGILGLVVAFFVVGDRITWSAGLLGLAWRAWLLLYSLPAWYTVLERPPRAL